MLKRYLPIIILVFTVLFNALFLLPELITLSPDLNDNVFHLGLAVSAQDEIEHGGNSIDHWVPYWSIGYPVFHHYQHFPHLLIVSIYNIFYRTISLFVILRVLNYLLIVLFPLALYFSLRVMRFSRLTASFAALFSLTLSNINGYGFELGSFIWRGSGMFTQLFAMFLLPIVLGVIYKTLNENKYYFWSAISLFLITISQVMFGLVAMVTGFILALTGPWDNILPRIRRLAVIIVFALVLSAYFWIPMLIDSPYHAHSPYDFPEKWDSYGARYVITQFFNGNIFDSGRLPIVTILAVIGFFFALSRRAFHYRFIAFGFIAWFLLYFGRPTWGPLLNLIPLSSALHLHRFVTMVHFFGAILAGIGMAVVMNVMLSVVQTFRSALIRGRSKDLHYIFGKFQGIRSGELKLAAILIIVILLIAPVYLDRFNYYQKNTEWLRANKVDYLKEKYDFNAMLSDIKSLPPARVYPGLRGGWGNNFKIGQTAVFYFLGPEKIPALSFLPFSWALTGDYSVNFNEYELSHYNLFNVKYILADDKKTFPEFAREIRRHGRFRLYEVDTTGYFDLVESPIAISADKYSMWAPTLMWLRSPLVAKKQFISIVFGKKITEEANIFSIADPLEEGKYSEASCGTMLIENPGKNQYSVKVKADKDCFLLFKMTYHPGWHAYVDGEEKEKVILSPGMIGVKVNPGLHEVVFSYRAPRFKTVLLFIGFLTAIGLFLWDREKR